MPSSPEMNTPSPSVPVNKLEPLLSKQFEVDVRPVLLIVQVKPLSVDIAKPLLLAP